ncbi:hypothetical protein ACO0LV_02365 [Pseudactinotalea sp. Z1739]|uniref:hypothetical protein n=1 Tax=Pseudactinotalea sp. Z1739 TaxID=3413028 RepID=UPI003C7D4663
MGAPALMVIIGTAVALTTIGWSARSMMRPNPSLPGQAAQALRAAGRRTMTALVATAATIAGFALWIALEPGSTALPIALAPAISAAVGVGVYSLLPQRWAEGPDTAVTPTRTASLEPRTWWNQSPRLPRALLIGSLAATLGLLVVGGVTSSVDEHGNPVLSREFAGGTMLVSAGPYPGWHYAVPLIAAVTVLAGVTMVAMRRLNTTAALPGPGLAGADAAWRRGSASVVCLISLAGLNLTLGGVAFIVGSAVHGVHQNVASAWSVAGAGLMIGGAVAVLTAAPALTLAVLRSVDLTNRAVDAASTIGTTRAGSAAGTGGMAPR